MREILFRAKAINRDPDFNYRSNYKNGDWVYGLITKLYNEKYDIPAEMVDTSGISGIEVDCNTTGESTGLKDKNGKLIFEGDVVDVDNALLSGRFWVEYGMSGAFIVKDKDDRRYFLGGCNCTVVGNAYDNPELLEEERE